MEFRFVAIEQWPGERTRFAISSSFRAEHSDTLRLLDRELGYLRARNVVIQADCDRSQIRMDGMLYAGAKLRSAGIILSFDSKHGPLSYPCDKYSNWQANLRAIALSLEALRAVDRYGVTRRAEQYKGWAKLPPPEAALFGSDGEAASFLASIVPAIVPSDLLRDVEIYRSAYRSAAAATHPDRTAGDDSAFKRVQAARLLLDKRFGV